MKAILATGLFGAVAIAVMTEVMNVVVTFTALQHAASYNSWMSM
ncbi:hypothetical protein [Methylocystis echinoides]|jgi:hypothetical protein